MSEVKHAFKQVSDIVGEIAANSEGQWGIEQVHQAKWTGKCEKCENS
jgi:hypothetical protein